MISLMQAPRKGDTTSGFPINMNKIYNRRNALHHKASPPQIETQFFHNLIQTNPFNSIISFIYIKFQCHLTKKLSEVELEREEISTKFDEANQIIGALRFEHNFLAEKTKKLKVELFQVKAQLERTLSTKLNEMLSLQKSASDRTGLGYDFSSPSLASTNTTIFVPLANNVEIEKNNVKNELASENIDKGKSILGAPLKFDKKETRNTRSKKGNNQKSKQKKQHFSHHCGASGHTHPNCYKWLATQQSNSMISPGNQNQFLSSFAPFGDLLKAFIFLSNLNGFNSSSSPLDQGLTK